MEHENQQEDPIQERFFNKKNILILISMFVIFFGDSTALLLWNGTSTIKTAPYVHQGVPLPTGSAKTISTDSFQTSTAQLASM